MTTFIYKCTNCHTLNETSTPPEDSMLQCKKCGYLTVQYFYKVKATLAAAPKQEEEEK